MTWVGWWWDGRAWVRLCEGDTLGAASSRLYALRPLERNFFLALTGGHAPPWRPREG